MKEAAVWGNFFDGLVVGEEIRFTGTAYGSFHRPARSVTVPVEFNGGGKFFFRVRWQLETIIGAINAALRLSKLQLRRHAFIRSQRHMRRNTEMVELEPVHNPDSRVYCGVIYIVERLSE